MPAPSLSEILFYDGHCGLCHRAVRFVLWAGRGGDRFHFAPLGGETFQKLVPNPQRAGLPDSIVLRTSEGKLLVRSAAMWHILRKLGGVWRAMAIVFGLLPRGLCDGLYDFIARRRGRWFGPPADVCPVAPGRARSRFLR